VRQIGATNEPGYPHFSATDVPGRLYWPFSVASR